MKTKKPDPSAKPQVTAKKAVVPQWKSKPDLDGAWWCFRAEAVAPMLVFLNTEGDIFQIGSEYTVHYGLWKDAKWLKADIPHPEPPN